MSVLSLSHISLTYSGTAQPVLKDVTLSLSQGDFISVIGRSGSGKTSLMNLAAGFLQPSSGQVSIGGAPFTGPGPDRAVVFQDDALFPWRTVVENVALPLKLAGVAREEREATARRWLAAVHLEGQEDKHIWQLSGGQRQRVGIARALASGPDFLLMDEPLGALDAMTRDRMHELLLQLWAQSHTGALLITHSVEEALFLSTSVVVLAPDPGRISFQESYDYGRRFIRGEDPRALKSEPGFIAARERLLAAIYEKEPA
ncbi:ATP-binding cassette domain-containing protein [Pseudomonas sp. GX19020]|uniref:taurine ABC transporter ATP-binding protein n=1 Tax=Pseudomonas sp. GX19020 TaxID=2942277 RepID=UPI002018E6B4|nr:ATP-binding cassette domain-containing protein [Pseudomonas sp. GX19020]MCL4066010.1 ATP-binding cassette domain-containing protein [Pseudomonas sp. GX19020]